MALEGGEIRVSHPRIFLVEWGRFTDQRPRAVKSNGRLGVSRDVVRVPWVRIRADGGRRLDAPPAGNEPHQGMVGYRHRNDRARRRVSC